MTLFCGRNDEGFQLWPNTQSLESGFFGFRLFWFFVLPVRVLYSILLLVGSLPCRNPKWATRKNVPAIYPWHVGYSLASELAGVQVLVRKGRLKKIGPNRLRDFLRPPSKWVKHDVCLVVSKTPNSKFPQSAVKAKKRRFWHSQNTPPIKKNVRVTLLGLGPFSRW